MYVLDNDKDINASPYSVMCPGQANRIFELYQHLSSQYKVEKWIIAAYYKEIRRENGNVEIDDMVRLLPPTNE